MGVVAYRWGSRGIGLDVTPGCFVCGSEWRSAEAFAIGNDHLHNIAAHVSPIDERAVLACFERGARMGYYHADPNAPQIKVGACDRHLAALEKLSEQRLINGDLVAELVKRTLNGELSDAWHEVLRDGLVR